MRVDELDTPVAVVDLDRLEANIARLQSYLGAYGIANRPHIKTHKIPEIARMQVAAGGVGITCQKLGEAEVMADAGIDDIFVPYNILGGAKLERLAALARRIHLSVTADSEPVVRGLSEAMSAAGLTLPVLVECDTGLGRCGVQTPQQAVGLATMIAGAPGLAFGGLMTYPNSDWMDAFVRETKALLEPHGIPVERVSGGGTGGMRTVHEHPEVTEHRAGEYVYGDRYALAGGVMRPDEIAFSVNTTVVSRPTPDRAVLDGGSKTFSSDLRGLDGHGLIVEYPEARISALTEEHGHVDVSNCGARPEVGERVTVIPNHVCVVSNLFNEVVAVRGGIVQHIWPVACRGLLR
jgi:D-serine deaminase-like pyridoxal phosphate-dependent protein